MKQAVGGNRILIGVGVAIILSGVTTAFGGMQELLLAWDMLYLTYPLTIAKLVGGALLIWNKTRTVGTLFNIAYFGGALAVHVAFSAYDFMFGVALVVMALLWTGFFLRRGALV